MRRLVNFFSTHISKQFFMKFPVKFRYWISYSYLSLKAIPKLFKFLFSDFSKVNLICNKISLDFSTICQLKCPICPTGKGRNALGTIGAGFLSFEDFKKFTLRNPKIKNIEIANWGEIFLNPQLKKIIKYAYFKNINLTAKNGVNLNDTGIDVLEFLVKYKFKYLNVSLDGTRNETYKIYRCGGNFNKVIKNIKIINNLKTKYNTKYPILIWQFIIFGHNEHELPLARRMAKELGMIFYPKLNREETFSPIRNRDFVKIESNIGVALRSNYIHLYKEPYSPSCYKFWISPQINWDGKLLGCGCNIWEDFGNVFTTNLRQCLNNEKFIHIKRVLLGKERIKKKDPCFNCPKYKDVLRIRFKKRNIIINLAGF